MTLPAFSVLYLENYHRRSQTLNWILYSKKATKLKYMLNCFVLGGGARRQRRKRNCAYAKLVSSKRTLQGLIFLSSSPVLYWSFWLRSPFPHNFSICNPGMAFQSSSEDPFPGHTVCTNTPGCLVSKVFSAPTNCSHPTPSSWFSPWSSPPHKCWSKLKALPSKGTFDFHKSPLGLCFDVYISCAWQFYASIWSGGSMFCVWR